MDHHNEALKSKPSTPHAIVAHNIDANHQHKNINNNHLLLLRKTTISKWDAKHKKSKNNGLTAESKHTNLRPTALKGKELEEQQRALLEADEHKLSGFKNLWMQND